MWLATGYTFPTRRILRIAVAVCVIGAFFHFKSARAEIPVSIELVLAVDISRSVDAAEYDLQMTGIANAFRDPEIVDHIGQQDGVAVALFQWDEAADDRRMIPWHLLTDPTTVGSFADKVAALERSPVRKFTGIGRALEFSVRLITENAFAGRQMKIDISGDGRDNIGSLPSAVRRQAEALGIEINGLPILVDTYNLDIYYREHVILGPGAFLEIAHDYNDFARAFRRKLRREIAPSISRDDHGPVEPPVRAAAAILAGSAPSASPALAAAIPMSWTVEHRTDSASGSRICAVASHGGDVTARLIQEVAVTAAAWTVTVGRGNAPDSLRYIRIGKAYYTSDRPSFGGDEAEEIVARLKSPGEFAFEWAQAPDFGKRQGLYGTGNFAAKAAQCEQWIGGTRI